MRIMEEKMETTLGFRALGGPPPHPAIVTTRDNTEHIRVLLFRLYHYYRARGPPKRYGDFSTLVEGVELG